MGFTFEFTKADLVAHLESTNIALSQGQIDSLFAEIDVEGIEERIILSDKNPQQTLFHELQAVLRGITARFEVAVLPLEKCPWEGSVSTVATHVNVAHVRLLSGFIFELAKDADFPAPLYAWFKQMETAANYIESGQPPEQFDPKHSLKARRRHNGNGNGNGKASDNGLDLVADIDPRGPGEIR